MQYVVHDPDDGEDDQVFPTLEEAISHAEYVIGEYCYDGIWGEGIDEVYVYSRVILFRPERQVLAVKSEMTEQEWADFGTPDADEVWEYNLKGTEY